MTNKQWIDMWMQVKQIEKLNEDIRERDKNDLKYQVKCAKINIEVRSIKKAIQSIIGQME